MKNLFIALICLSVMLFAETSMAHMKDGVWQIHKAAYPPDIDGEMDDLYFAASSERIILQDQDDPAPPDGYLDLFAHARLLWDEDYLYVFIKVMDDEISSTSANSWENDSVEYFFDGDNSKSYQCFDGWDDVQIRVEYQDGSDAYSYDSALEGTVGAVSDWNNPAGDAYGYTVEVGFPMWALNIDAVEGTMIGFEIQINDRDNETRENIFRWWGNSNDAWHWAHIWGEAELTDYMADDVMQIMKAPYAPEIDGVLDEVWTDTAPEIYQGTYVFSNNGVIGSEYTEMDSWEDAQLAFRVMWDEQGFYFWGEVIDDEISTSSPNSWDNDSIELDFDGDNAKGYSFDANDIQWRWVWNDAGGSSDIGNYAWGEPASDMEGYTFEIRIPSEQLPFVQENDTEIGFEVQVNDRDNEIRENMIHWWGNDNMTWLEPFRFGTIVLTSDGDLSPYAAFSASPRTGNKPLSVHFDDQSTGSISSRLWNFGDGQTSASSDVSHTYLNPGAYTVRLTVYGPGGTDTAEKFNYITVTDNIPDDQDYLQIVRAAYPPMIDGEMDEIWYTASTGRVIKPDQSDSSPPIDYMDHFATMRLMWDEINLYIFIKVVDDEISYTSPNSWENDSVEYFFDGDNSKTFESYDGVDDNQIRIEYNDYSTDQADAIDYWDRSGFNYTVSDWENLSGDAFGYIIEAQYPLYNLNIDSDAGTLFGFEVQINDRDNEMRENMMRWWGTSNDTWHWAHLFGTAELIDYEANDYLNIPYTAVPPDIDGFLDDVWKSKAPPIYQGTYVFQNNGVVSGEYTEMDEWEDAQMEFRAMWDEDFFYFWCEVIDDEISISSPNPWENDSIELYFDGDNSKNTSYDANDIQWRWVWGNDYYYQYYYYYNIGIYLWGEPTSGPSGYTFEVAIPFENLTFNLEEGAEIGFEVQVNDRDNEWRENMMRWWSNDNMSCADPSLFGTAVLIKGGPVENPVIALQTPNGGEIWQVGSKQTIRWTSESVAYIKLEYSDDNGSSWHLIQSSISASNGTYTWTVPAINSSECKVKITDTSRSSLFDVSNQVFEIRNVNLALSDPNGGETFISGKVTDILWQSTGVGKVNIYISYNNGASWDAIATDQESTGIWSWTVPYIASMQAMLKIADADNSSIYDISDGYFIIKTGIVSGIDESGVPMEFSLHQNYPNPFNSGTWIRYGLPEPADVNLSIYNIEGKRIRSLVQDTQERGSYYMHWDGTDQSGRGLSNGMYICNIHAKGTNKSFSVSRKMYLVK